MATSRDGHGARQAGLSAAARSRIRASKGQPDLFGVELSEAQRASARHGAELDKTYERLKVDVRRKAKGQPNEYERAIKAVAKRLKY